VGKRKVTLDANILISALGWKGNPHKILQKVVDGEIELFISYDQLDELSRVLDYPKFDFTEEQKARFKALISEIATLVRPSRKLDIVKEDPSDNRILECALAADVDFVISGDEHLLSIGQLGRIKIVSAGSFLRAN
jgi:putative PIN family toxin of toxin-antitoxin system